MLFDKMARIMSFLDLSILVVGGAKTGKTTFVSHFVCDGRPPLFIMTEDGGKALDLHAVRVTSWEGFLKLKRKIVENAKDVREQHSMIVIDLATELDDMATAHTCRAHGASYLGDIPHGKGWYMQKDTFRTALRELFDVLPLTFIAHSKERENPLDGRMVIEPSMSRAALEYVAGKVDCVMYVFPQNGRGTQAKLTMKLEAGLSAGSRFPNLCRDFVLDFQNPAATVAELEKAMRGE